MDPVGTHSVLIPPQSQTFGHLSLKTYATVDRVLIEVEDKCGGLPAGEIDQPIAGIAANVVWFLSTRHSFGALSVDLSAFSPAPRDCLKYRRFTNQGAHSIIGGCGPRVTSYQVEGRKR
jgi:hypothetical protein